MASDLYRRSLSPLRNSSSISRILAVLRMVFRIEGLKRHLETIPPESQEYSAGLSELIALERNRRELGSSE